ncbi:trimeric intracellular cation channel family protein [Sediminibacterium sp.]|uniref:trimeric intracellular cation channel family protein n=1 Tax=Sediminibacterium sp. TaxID=1917865 RepID=UPI003F6A3638
MNSFFTILPDLIGTFAFAMSGIKMASRKNVDWFGAFMIGLVTAIGGGTVRDLLLDVTPFWMLDSRYFITTGVALLATLIFKENLMRWTNTLFLFDTIGLGLVTIIGISKCLDAGFPFWVCIVMGTITGSIGGVLRDVLLNEVPLLLQKDIYAMACVIGGVTFFLLLKLNLSKEVAAPIAALMVMLVRLIAIQFHIHLPVLKSVHDKEADNQILNNKPPQP